MFAVRRPWAAACTGALLVCMGLSVAGCDGFGPSTPRAKAPAGLETYYSQTLDWNGCLDDPAFSTGSQRYDEELKLGTLECAWLTVPMDYADPSGETIEIAVARSVAKNSKGSVIINPGGPGGSGVEAVRSTMDDAGDKLRDSLDIVGFDPRGVGRSAPVECVSDDELDVLLSRDVDTSTDEGRDEAQASADAFAQGCWERTGELLGHVDTVSAARDIDVLRAALGQNTLTYLGFSYGTQLGATYAALFPDNVGRLVLDGAVDPMVPPGEKSVYQAGGFESALRAYTTDCLTHDDCPLSGSVDEAMAQITDLVDSAEAHPLNTDHERQLTGSLALTGVLVAMYSPTFWESLTVGLTLALNNQDGWVLLVLADIYNNRCNDNLYCPEDQGFLGNSFEAGVAIRCADARDEADAETVESYNEQIRRGAPHLGKYFVDDGVDFCAAWPTPVADPVESFAAADTPPIVVIGTTNDPATPYVWAEALASLLGSAVLVTYQGEGHTAYTSGDVCIQRAVDGFLVDGKVPKDRLMC